MTRPSAADRSAGVEAVRALIAEREDGHAGRTRALETVNRKLKSVRAPLEDVIEELLAGGRHVSVLEIGFGWGPVLIELAHRFRSRPVSFAGINLERKPPVERSGDLAAVAEALELMPREDIDGFEWPEVHFYDATTLHFADESIDLAYSAVTIRFIADKARLLEEVARVLRPGGRAILHIGERNWEYPAGPATDPILLTPHPSRFVLRHDLMLVPLDDYLAWAGGDGFTIRVPRGKRCVIDMTKHSPGHLDLGLELDEERTIDMRDFPHPDRPQGAGGVRSAYAISAERAAAFAAARAG
jgi:SAM-dependent methyltransferase